MLHGDIGFTPRAVIMCRFERVLGIPPHTSWWNRRKYRNLRWWTISRLGAASLLRLRMKFDARIELFTFDFGHAWADEVYTWVIDFCPVVANVEFFSCVEALTAYARLNEVKRVFDPDDAVVTSLGDMRATLAVPNAELMLLV